MDFGVARVGVTRGYHHTRRHQLADELRSRHLRGERHERAAFLQRGEESERARIELAQLRRIVHALARDVEEWPLDVNAEDAGHARGDGGAHRGDGPRDDLEVGADQCWQEGGGAEAAVRGADGADRFDARCVVEEHAAAAVHLQVDEARQQQSAAQIVLLGRPAAGVSRRQHIDDTPLLDEHALAAHEAVRAQHPPVDQCEAHQSVSVTLRRCGGASGLCPRASDNSFAMR